MARQPAEIRAFVRNQRQFHERMRAVHMEARQRMRKSPIRVAVELLFMHAGVRHVGA
ncbi:hypothetical protein [Paraburkholderia phosphatilytica]|uniref:hypothetical protein n=1 Tax=Paraburkholderia phosphatilytica TaxID=2282883 RepID=UPI0013DFE28B|nr:hypothetical protein [Paraburkholderia phosphatilytica]